MSGLFGEDAPVEQGIPEPTAYRVLARKYRPTGFGDLIGQEALVRTLRNAFSIGRIAHAFMLTGVRGVGKTTTARIIARALNCTGPDGHGGPTATPCGTCADCRSILADRHPDVVEMDAASRTGVDDVREIIEGARFRPMQARTKVFIVDEVHMLSRNAFNALLKTLEEPPSHVKFIFATTEWRKVPVTVLSRCQRFDLQRVSIVELTKRFARITELEGARASPEALDMIAQAADGSVRDGLSLLDQAIALGAGDEGGSEVSAALVTEMLGLGDRSVVFDVMEALVAGQVETVLSITDRMHERGADLGVMVGDLLELSHLLTRLRSMPALSSSKDLPELERTRGIALAARLPIPVLTRIWQVLLKGLAEIEAAPDRRAAAEMVLIRLCYLADMPSPGELITQLKQSSVSSVAELAPARRDAYPAAQLIHSSALATQAEPAARPATVLPAEFTDVVALAEMAQEPLLSGYLQHSVHLVRYAPPIIELRPEPETPRDFTAKLAAFLMAQTGTRWTIAVSTASGDITLGAKYEEQALARRTEAEQHPLIRAVLQTFPGAILRSGVQTDELLAASRRAYDDPQAEAMPPSEAPHSYTDTTEIDL